MGKKMRRPGSKTRKSKCSFVSGIADWTRMPKSWREGGRWIDEKRRVT